MGSLLGRIITGMNGSAGNIGKRAFPVKDKPR